MRELWIVQKIVIIIHLLQSIMFVNASSIKSFSIAFTEVGKNIYSAIKTFVFSDVKICYNFAEQGDVLLYLANFILPNIRSH